MDRSTNYKILKKIINKEDPLGLIDFDTSESLDEYEPELEQIFKKDILAFSNEELGEWIYQVFVLFSNEELAKGKEKYYIIADKFIDAVKNES